MNGLSLLGLVFGALGAAAERDRRRRERERRQGLSGLGFARGGDWADPTGQIRGDEFVEVNTIDDRLRLIVDQIRKDSASPRIEALADSVVTQVCGDQWCVAERDWNAEIAALFHAMRDPTSPIGVRYTLDRAPRPLEEGGPIVGDQFSSAEATIRRKRGDCDDMTIALGALAMSIGYPVKCRVVQTRGSSSWNHIYLLVGIPPENPTQWIALDPTEPNGPGWQVNGADRTALTGRAAGETLAVRDWEV